MNSETQICLPLLWALSLGLGSVFWTSEANFVTSLDVGVLFLDVGLMTLSLRTCLMMLPWALGSFALTLLGHCRKADHVSSPLHPFSLSALASARSSTSRLGLSGV